MEPICSGKLLLIFMLLHVALVNSDLQILNEAERSIAFQTASEPVQVQTCGVFSAYSKIISPDPITACELPKKPSVYNTSNLYGNMRENTQWILFFIENGESCSLQEQLRMAAVAGYSGVIVGTFQSYKEVMRRLSTDMIEVIDFHLVNPFDVKVISAKYAYPNEYMLAPTITSVNCTIPKIVFQKISNFVEQYKKKLRETSTFVLGKLRGFTPTIFLVFLERGSFKKVPMIQLIAFVCASIYLLFYIAQKVINRVRRARSSDCCYGDNWEDDSEWDRVYNELMDNFPDLHQHMSILEIELDDWLLLKLDMVISAHRRLSMKYHPDRHADKSEDFRLEMGRKSARINAARDDLVEYCAKLEELNKIK